MLAEEGDIPNPIHVDPRKCRSGDPLAVVESAIKEHDIVARSRGSYELRVIFLDTDRRSEVPDRSARADRLLELNGFLPIWSAPTLEALLLKHFSGCEHLDPASPELALRLLRGRWPGYHKGMKAKELRARFDLGAVKRAASVVPELKAFLDSIGLLR